MGIDNLFSELGVMLYNLNQPWFAHQLQDCAAAVPRKGPIVLALLMAQCDRCAGQLTLSDLCITATNVVMIKVPRGHVGDWNNGTISWAVRGTQA